MQGRLNLGPECLYVLVPGLQKTTRFMLNLNSIVVPVLFCYLRFFPPLFLVKEEKQFGFRSKCKREVWFGIQLIRVIDLGNGDLISTSFVFY